MKIDGGCHCGKITYTAEVDPESRHLSLHGLSDTVRDSVSRQCFGG